MVGSPFNKLGQRVDDEAIVVVTLGELRDSLGYGRLGRYVLDEIASKLEGEGLGYFPLDALDDNAEPRGGQEVRLYRRGKGIGKVIQAVTNPTEGGDRVLCQNIGEASETIEKIRSLVCA